MSAGVRGGLGPAVCCATADSRAAVELTLVALEPGLRHTARRLTDDPDLREDLVQEASICLWETDPTRFDLEDQEDLRYLCRILINRMWQVWKAEVARCVA